ncbi:TIGR04076 family protein [Eubacterium barkeri]|uniref:TIGR04076 family protein n=2 Tax=Eubacteriaceae TaxID=186806 RepID=A0A1H3IJ29_EUBBA|nr:TIGR04076 family protein [Eubacterium barkeri]
MGALTHTIQPDILTTSTKNVVNQLRACDTEEEEIMSEKVRITVLKKLLLSDVVNQFAGKDAIGICGKFEEGDEYITDGRTVPEGFCTWAWADIFKDIIFVRNNMECIGTLDKQSQIASCTDGFRPVVFRIEPID